MQPRPCAPGGPRLRRSKVRPLPGDRCARTCCARSRAQTSGTATVSCRRWRSYGHEQIAFTSTRPAGRRPRRRHGRRGQRHDPASGQASPHLAPGVTAATPRVPTATLPGGRAEARPLRVPARPQHASTGATFEPPRHTGRGRPEPPRGRSCARPRPRRTPWSPTCPRHDRALPRARAANAVAVYTDVNNFAALIRIRGSAPSTRSRPKRPALSYSVPHQRAPQGWQAYGDVGAHVRIAVIDSGVDYTHANFGGPGTVAAYEQALATDRRPAAPARTTPRSSTRRRARTARPWACTTSPATSTTPAPASRRRPGPEPAGLQQPRQPRRGHRGRLRRARRRLDLHRAYDTHTPFSTMRIGPGMAPMATHLRVQGLRLRGRHQRDRRGDRQGDGPERGRRHVRPRRRHQHVARLGLQLADRTATRAHEPRLASWACSSRPRRATAATCSTSPARPARRRARSRRPTRPTRYQLVDTLHVTAPSAIAGPYPAQRSVGLRLAHEARSVAASSCGSPSRATSTAACR